MNTFLRKILLTVAIIFGFTVAANNALADELILTVQFEKTPLFKEANFMPGNSVTRYIRITNNTGQNGTVLIKTTNPSDSERMGDKMTLRITEGGTERQNMPLTQFLSGTILPLSNLDNGSNTQYDLEISFDSTASDDYQGARLGFDISVGLEGEGGVTPTTFLSDNPGGGGGGMGYYLTPTPSPTPTVAGTATTGGGQGGTGGGLAQGGGIIGGASTTGESGGETLSPSPSPSPTGLAAGANILSAFGGVFSLWWLWLILILIALLILIRFLLKRKNDQETE